MKNRKRMEGVAGEGLGRDEALREWQISKEKGREGRRP